MTLAEIAREYGILAALLIGAVVSVWGTFKLALPRLLENYLEREKAKAAQEATERAAQRELQTELLLGERDDEKAVISQMVHLQAQITKQNDILIAFLIETVNNDLKKIASMYPHIVRNNDLLTAHSINISKLTDEMEDFKIIGERIGSIGSWLLESKH